MKPFDYLASLESKSLDVHCPNFIMSPSFGVCHELFDINQTSQIRSPDHRPKLACRVIHLLVNSFKRHLSSFYYAPDSVLGTGDIAMSKITPNLCLQDVFIPL